MRAAATFATPLSVARRLNWAAAFLVSWTSTRIPSELICLRVSGEMGCTEGPSPRIRRSACEKAAKISGQISSPWIFHYLPGFGHTSSSKPQASFSTSHCPFLFIMRPFPEVPSLLPAIQGLQENASPPSKKQPLPSEIFSPLSKWKPSLKQASMAVVGGGELPNTFKVPKWVWVSSFEVGPRSVDFGAEGRLRTGVLENAHISGDACCGNCMWEREGGDEQGWRDRCNTDRGRHVWMNFVALVARKRFTLGGGMIWVLPLKTDGQLPVRNANRAKVKRRAGGILPDDVISLNTTFSLALPGRRAETPAVGLNIKVYNVKHWGRRHIQRSRWCTWSHRFRNSQT